MKDRGKHSEGGIGISNDKKHKHTKICPRKRGRLSFSCFIAQCKSEIRSKIGHRWLIWILPILGFVSLIWFLVRVIPKPSRATYPCQRVASPLASGFVVWILGIIGSVFAGRKAKRLLRNSRLIGAAFCFSVAVVAAAIAIVSISDEQVIADSPVPNDPIGNAKGIHPGRVVWVHNPDATDWEGTNYDGEDIGDGYWFEDEHTDLAAVKDMMTKAICGLAGDFNKAEAWDGIFRYFNKNKGKGDVGYLPGEKITIKVNLVTAIDALGAVDANDEQISKLGWVNTSPQMIVALLDQLVNVVGVEPNDITVGDTTTHFPNHYWNYCHGAFPEVHCLANTGLPNRRIAEYSQGYPCETVMYWSDPDTNEFDYLPVSYAEAEYLINFACLKGHSSGITLCAKNHYGSFIRRPHQYGYDLHQSLPNAIYCPGMGHYRAHVDIIGHSHLGGKTLLYLVDGLYGGYYSEGRPYKWFSAPFGDGENSDWPSSLFASQDPVAIDSVGYDFLEEEWPDVVAYGGASQSLQGGAEDYLHEAALADNPPSGTFYDPDHDGNQVRLTSLGVHEHWNNPSDKQYSRNLGTGDGIELFKVVTGDLDLNGYVDFIDYAFFAEHWTDDCNDTTWCDGVDLDKSGAVDMNDLGLLLQDWFWGK